jgi:hypothetical protein
MNLRWLAALPLIVVIGGCEEQKPYKPPTPHTDQGAESTLFQSQRKALQDAKDVEQTLQKQSEEQRKAAEEAGR